MSVLTRIEQLERLSPAERRVARVLEKDTRQAAFSNLVGISEKAGVGPATVTRFIRRLGYSGFPEFMRDLRANVTDALDVPLSRYIRSNQPQMADPASFAHVYLERVVHTLYRTMNSLDPLSMEQAVHSLTDTTKTAYVTGGGTAEAMARFFTLLAQHYRENVRLLEPNVGSLGHQLAGANADTVLLCIAYHRCSNISLQVMKLFAGFGGTTILLTDRRINPLMRFASTALVVDSEGGGLFSSRAAGLAVLEALLTAMGHSAQKIIPARFERMEEVFAAIEAFAYAE